MKIGLRGGHSPFAKGAIGIIDEQINVRQLSKRLKLILEKYGHTVVDCNSDANTITEELNEGTNKANNNNCDIFLSLHMNVFDGTARGVEAFVYDTSSTVAIDIGNRVCSNLSSLGLPNRGIKYMQELHDLNATTMQAAIIELLYCDNKLDVEIWSRNIWDTIIYLLANAIDPKIPKINPVDPSNNDEKETFYRVICGSFKEKNNAEARKKDLVSKGFKEAFIYYYKEKGLFRVVCGSFKNRDNADKRRRELTGKGFSETFIDVFVLM